MLVVVPHGGLCAHDLLELRRGGTLRGNDLHTGEVARALAQRLGASLIENLAVDRNQLDLNRVDEVTTHAPWFLDLLREHLGRILARHAHAEVLFVHGWHVVQPTCDVGVGARLATPTEAAKLAPRLTASPSYVASALDTLRALGARDGIHTTFGERWPAAHPNNVMQLFRRVPRATGGPCAALADLTASGRTHAVQLELGAPLRFPGAWRERFVAAAAAAFGGAAQRANVDAGASVATPSAALVAPRGHADARRGHGDAAQRAAAATAGAHAPVRGVALQAHDAAVGAHGLGIVAGLGALGPDEIGGRLLLLPGGQRVLLFTGHGRPRADGRLALAGLEAEIGEHTAWVRFRGPLLDIPDAALYFRDERAQLAARVVGADVELHYATSEARTWGWLEGRVRLDGAVLRVGATAFTDPVLARLAPERPGVRLRLVASFGADLGAVADLDPGEPASSLRLLGDDGATALALAEEADGAHAPLPDVVPGRLTPPFALALRGGGALRCTPRSHVTILRPVRPGLFARVTFGVAGYALGERRGSGFYEHTTAFACGADAREPT